jgi:predicted Zn finger-like uncharacterized protein
MQVTCPNCRARYAVDPLAIGPTGRTVQCARCSHRWFEIMRLSDNPAPSPDPDHRPVQRPPAQAESTDMSSYTANLPAVIAPPPKVRWGRWSSVALVGVLAAGAAAFAYRDELKNHLPGQWRAVLGEAVAAPKPILVQARGPRVELDMDASSVELADGRYVVRGELVNGGTAPGSTTALKLVFRRGDDVLGERTYPLVEGPIAPGQRLSFTRPFDDPPDGTTNVVPSVE